MRLNDSRGLAHGRGVIGEDDDFEAARRATLRALQAAPEPEPRAWVRDVSYSAAYNSTANAPSGDQDGLELADGSRIFAEARSVTASSGADALTVTLRASQNGARAYIETPTSGATIAGGSVRFWVMEPTRRVWHLGNVDETLPTGVARVATSDQLVTVGAR